ncbi:hypothetical protein CWO91_16570 [Bradyrhizobium genosp. SA-3]|nr:hypothetical protein CWO91_16570 [Bradyrhizobium genosp. SA-3]
MIGEKELALAAAQLAYRAPQEFAQFVSALSLYAEKRRDELLECPPDTLTLNQGRAKACAHIRDTIANATRTAEAIQQKQAQRPSVPRRPHAAP